MKKFLLIFFFSFSCWSCSSTNSYELFQRVREDVADRTDYCIQWGRSEDPCIKNLIQEMLSQELTLDHVVQISVLNNKRLQAIYEKLGIAQADLVQATLFQNPVLDLSLRYDHPFGLEKIIEIGLLQNFLDVMLKPSKVKKARLELETLKDEVIGDVLEVIADSKIAFFNLLAANHTLLLKKHILETIEASFDVAERLHAAGNLTDLELATERSLYELSKIDIVNSEMEVVDAREKLNVIMGLWGSQINWNISMVIPQISKKIAACQAIEDAIVYNSLDLRNARRQIYASAAKAGINTAEIVFPELKAGVDSEREVDGNWFVGPQFSIGIPIFDFGQARIAAGRAELRQRCYEYSALAIEIRSIARATSFKLWKMHQQSLNYEDIVFPLAEELTQETLLQANAMQIGIFEVLSAKRREIETKEKAILAYRDFWIVHTELELLMNGRMKDKTGIK